MNIQEKFFRHVESNPALGLLAVGFQLVIGIWLLSVPDSPKELLLLLVLPLFYILLARTIMPESYKRGFLAGSLLVKEKEKVIITRVSGVPQNKVDECKQTLADFANQHRVEGSEVTAKSDAEHLLLEFKTLKSIASVREDLIKIFPIDIVHDSTVVHEGYRSMDAMGKLKLRFIVEGIATPGSEIIFDDDLNKTKIIADSSGRYSQEITIVVSSGIIKRGFIEGVATKGSMTKRIRADLEKAK